MKRIILLLILVVFITGCSAEVNINVFSNGIYEQVTITDNVSNGRTKEHILASYREYVPAFSKTLIADTEPDVKLEGVEYYTRALEETNTGYKVSYGYKFGFDNYKDSRSVDLGFKDAIIQRDAVDKEILLTTDSDGLKYFNMYPALSNVTINIVSTEFKVKDSNADYVNNNVYTWVLNGNTKKSVYIVFDDPNYVPPVADSGNTENDDVTDKEEDNKVSNDNVEVEEEEQSGIEKFMNENPFVVVCICLIIFLIFVMIVIKISKSKYE